MGLSPLFFLMAMSIVTLNCNGIRDSSKRSGLVQWLRSLPVSASVICLQETHCRSLNVPPGFVLLVSLPLSPLGPLIPAAASSFFALLSLW